ncbi:MAG: hypothetical protein HOV87_18825 [Catenulispora sp.]|nr:hypothetical protein [Catenulispora sp.]
MNRRSRGLAALAASAVFSFATGTATATYADSASAATSARSDAVAIAVDPITATGARAADQRTTYALPTGDTVTVRGTGRHAVFSVTGKDGTSVPSIRYDIADGHAYVIPASVIGDAKPFNPADYDIPALAVAPEVAKSTVVPHYPLHIVQVNATDLAGAPASALTVLVNAEDIGRFTSAIQVIGGVGRAAVPAGHYTAYTWFVDKQFGGPLDTEIDTMHVVMRGDFEVPADGGTTPLTADARAASAAVTAATPRPATTDETLAFFNSTDVAGQTATIQVSGPGPLWVQPQPKPQLGDFSYQVVWGGGDVYGPDPYHYDLMYPPVDHVDANQTWPVDPAKLAVQHNTLDTDAVYAQQRGVFGVGFEFDNGAGLMPAIYPRTPSHITEYVSAPVAGAHWFEEYSPTITTTAIALFASPRAIPFTPGTETWRTWFHGPLTPQIGQVHGAARCGACADGSTLGFSFPPLVDSEPDTQLVALGGAATHFTFYRGDTKLFDQDQADGVVFTGLPQEAATYRAVFDTDLTGSGLSQSTATHTDVSFPYRPSGDPALPAEDSCHPRTRPQEANPAPCRILPILNLGYHLDSDATNTSRKPLQKLDLTVGHQSFDGIGSQAAVTGVTVSVSFDSGKTWSDAHVAQTGCGRFEVHWKNAAPHGTTPWLRVTARDAIGGSISQTVQNAYTIG